MPRARSVAHAAAFTFACIVFLVAPLRAQSASRISVSTTVGRGIGWSAGEYRDSPSRLVADLVVGVRLHRAAGGVVVAGVSALSEMATVQTTDCLGTIAGGCVPRFPEFGSLGALTGWESGQGIVRLMGGPALMFGPGGAHALGVEGRLDLSTPPLWRLAATASLDSRLIPNYRGHSARLLSFGVGIRVR